jgi:two-component system phosphate regulon sensor histidine kinase PhoR
LPDSDKDRPLMKRMVRPTSVRETVRLRGADEHPDKPYFRLITTAKSLDDSLPVDKVDSAYRKDLAKANIPLSFRIKMGKDDSLHRKDTADAAQFATIPTTVGLAKPNWYQAEFDNPTTLLMRKISPQILFSVFLVAFTSVAFVFLYRNLSAQRRLTQMKNDFISNITHELKTPIATVSVAVEALRNFGGIQSPERTKEYLDISASELQRLGLLVDKVLKLSLFENRELEIKKEPVDLKELLHEVLNTMKLQFEKCRAILDLDIEGHYFLINADRLHITSVIYNLLDNALKYSKDKPEITVHLKHDTDFVVLSVADKGIGIPAGFTNKIFDKFFRVPTGDHHNIKGYGLGLSYVSHVVNKHDGSIGVESEPGKGSTFTVKLPIA